MSKRKASGGGGANKKQKDQSPGEGGAGHSQNAGESEAASAEKEKPSLSVDEQLEIEVARLKDGTHPDLISKTGDLVKAKEKALTAADRHRKLLIKNINELYEFEMQDAEVRFGMFGPTSFRFFSRF